MRFLLDTHIFIWWMRNDKRLSENIRQIIMDPDNTILLSIASIWEMVIKKKSGKLRLPKSWKQDIKSGIFQILPINLEHVFSLERLPLYHKDPFDRALIVQAKVENCTLITADPKIRNYKIATL